MTCVALEIAGVPVDLELSGPEPAALLRLRRFERAAGLAAWSIVLRPGGAPSPAPIVRFVAAAGGRWVVPGSEPLGWLDPAARRGEVSLDAALAVLDALLRAAVGSTVLARGGLLLHGASIQVDGQAHLFPARSGSGKSTLSALAGHPLADELSILLPGEGGFVAHATPWWTSRGGSAPLAGVYALSWDGEAITPGAGTALRQLASNLVLPLDTPALRARALAVAAQVARAVPFARLSFRPGTDVDALLRAPERAVG